MTEQPDLKAVNPGPAADLVGGRLRDGRQPRLNAAENLAEALEHRPRRAGARRRLRQRQRRDRRRAAHLGRTRSAPTSSPACSSADASGLLAERLEVEFVEADAQDLPFEDASFDVAISIYGAMFAPDQEQHRGRAAARGQARRPDRDGQLVSRRRRRRRCSGRSPSTPAAAAGGHAAARSGAPRSACASCSATASPSCGSSAGPRARPSARPITTSSSSAPISARSRPPSRRVGPEGEAALTADLRAFLEEANTAGDRALVLEPEYLQVIATRA